MKIAWIYCLQGLTSDNSNTKCKNYYDLDYQRVETDFPKMKVVLSIKKKRNVEFTQKEKTTKTS
jgi:hypothetical protein